MPRKSSNNSPKTKSEIKAFFKRHVDTRLKKGLIWSDWALRSMFEGMDYDEEHDAHSQAHADEERDVDEAINELLEEKKIYKTGDQMSYFEIVRDPGYVSVSEDMMIKAMEERQNATHRMVHADVEFPTDVDGRYYFDHMDEQEFHVVEGVKFYMQDHP